jgi:Flp pilus assembly protein protease CpaA
MDPLMIYRVAAILIIAFVYMVFDVFNRRNVPTIFAYGTVAVGLLFTLFYYPDIQTMEISVLIFAIVFGIGYIFYKAGQLGAADVLEFAAISLILPIQSMPYLINYTQLDLPFILAVFIATGIIALLMIPVYYLPRAKRILKGKLTSKITNADYYKGLVLCIAYGAFIAFLIYYLQISAIGIALMVVLMVSSVVTAVFEIPITDSMIEYISVRKFEEGDIVATNLMKKSEVESMKSKINGFDRLLTAKIIKRMMAMHIKQKFPVYRNAMPLALPIFIGVVLSILFGNIMLVII